MKKIITIIALAVILIAGLTYWEKKADAPAEAGGKTYTSEEYGFSFEYPEGYVLTEQETAEGYAVVLVLEEDATPRVDSEGPISINVNVYSGNADRALLEWLTNDIHSNYDPLRVHTSTTVGDLPALTYEWSGLYEGKSVAVKNGDDIIVFSRTRIAMEDKTVADFEPLVESVKFK